MIVSTEKLPEECYSLLQEYELREATEANLTEAEYLISWPSKLRSLVSKMPKLKVIQTLSAGVDDVPYDLLRNAVVLSNAGAYSTSVAEHAWALALALAKGVNVRKREPTYSITDQTALVLGAGGIGSEIARIAKQGFRMRVIGVSRSFRRPELFDEMLPMDQLKEAIRRGDVVFDTLPLNKSTRGVLNYSVLSLLKERAILVNVGRAETIVEEDVMRVLKERKDVRFGTDVFWRKDGKENFESELWNMDNFMGTYHTAGASASGETLRKAMIKACNNLKNYLEKGESENVVKLSDYV